MGRRDLSLPNVDRVMGITLVGKADTRRTEYFMKAARELSVSVEFVDWEDFDESCIAGKMMKLDPPSFQTANLFEMNKVIEKYCDTLVRLQEVGASFLNSPLGITKVLHKYQCKQILQSQGVPTTQMWQETITTVEELHEYMNRHRMYSVFVKPVYCSGAAGVTAYRWHPRSGKATAYTSCVLKGKELVNTKKLRRVESPKEIQELLKAILSLGVVVERWVPKAVYQGKSYDLRVVWQFGKPSFMVARQSSGPITNLHLNNGALPWEQLDLTEKNVADIEGVCGQAMACFPELHMAGIDILLEKDTLKPHIIEVNGQGDLMYQDIFRENRIYKEQIQWMTEQ